MAGVDGTGVDNDGGELVLGVDFVGVISVLIETEGGRESHRFRVFLATPVEAFELNEEDVW